jgi:DNA gyrase/topoisomerase IV subunit A
MNVWIFVWILVLYSKTFHLLTKMSLANLEKKRDQLVLALANLNEEVAKAKKKQELEKIIEESKQKLKELEEDTPERRAQLEQERRIKAQKDYEEAEKERLSRPPYWPLPRANMSQIEQNEWYDDHGF